MKILLLDNYDSFTFNLAHIIKDLITCSDRLDIIKNDEITANRAGVYDKIILSPGPGLPKEAGNLLPIIKKWAPHKSILGICLGHQALAQVFGGQLYNPKTVFHGLQSKIKLIQKSSIFEGIPSYFEAGRYHSWLVKEDSLPESIWITAIDEVGHIMAISHQTYDVHGLQFHPESIMTPQGRPILDNFLANRVYNAN